MNRKKKPRKDRGSSQYIPPSLLALAGGPPTYMQSNVSAGPRKPMPNSPEILARQNQVYELRAHGYSIFQIAQTIKVSRFTALADHSAELMRRLEETQPKKSTLTQQTISRIESSMARSVGRITKLTADAETHPPGSIGRLKFFQAAAREERNYLAAIDKWNEVYDLKRAEHDRGTESTLNDSDTKVLRILDLLPVEELISIREDAALLEKRFHEEAQKRGIRPQPWAS